MKHSEYLESVKNRIIEAGYLTVELADFYKSIFKFQEDYIEKFNQNPSDVSFLNSNDFPHINVNKIKFSSEVKPLLSEGLKVIINLIESNHSGLKLGHLLDAFNEDNSIYENSIRSLLNSDFDGFKKISDELKIGVDEYIFIIINWLKPYFINLRNQYFANIDTSEWYKSICPFCGYYADISKIIESKENIRILHCGFCENEWQFQRLSCTICENSDPEKLGYFTLEDDTVYRIDYCDECKGFIKTIRIPDKYEETRYDMNVENIITNYLDASVIEKGYNRP